MEQAIKIPEFATIIPRRKPEFKTHRTYGHAKQALLVEKGWDPVTRKYKIRGGTIYRLTDSYDGHWKIEPAYKMVIEVAPGTVPEDIEWPDV